MTSFVLLRFAGNSVVSKERRIDYPGKRNGSALVIIDDVNSVFVSLHAVAIGAVLTFVDL